MSGVVAASVAAKAKQLIMMEEEELTKYTQDELNHKWEFKIMRSLTGAFRIKQKIQQLI